jgi:hypothetical protein
MQRSPHGPARGGARGLLHLTAAGASACRQRLVCKHLNLEPEVRCDTPALPGSLAFGPDQSTRQQPTLQIERTRSSARGVCGGLLRDAF